MPGDRTEQATQHRRDKARKDGDILHSRELTTGAGTLAGVLVLGIAAKAFLPAWGSAFAGFLNLGQPHRWEASELEPTLMGLRRLALAVLGPAGLVMAAVAAAALAVAVVQTGGVSIHPSAVGFK